MKAEFRLEEKFVYPAYLKTLYDTIEELSLKQHTYLEERYNKDQRRYTKTRVVEVFGSSTMISWLLLRMERYSHIVNKFNKGESIVFNDVDDVLCEETDE